MMTMITKWNTSHQCRFYTTLCTARIHSMMRKITISVLNNIHVAMCHLLLWITVYEYIHNFMYFRSCGIPIVRKLMPGSVSLSVFPFYLSRSIWALSILILLNTICLPVCILSDIFFLLVYSVLSIHLQYILTSNLFLVQFFLSSLFPSTNWQSITWWTTQLPPFLTYTGASIHDHLPTVSIRSNSRYLDHHDLVNIHME